MLMYGIVLIASGYTTKRLVDYFVDPNASDISKQNFEKKMTVSSNIVGGGIYKNEEEINDEFSNLKEILPKHLKNPAFF